MRAMGYETDLKLFIDGVWKSGEGRDAHTVLNPVNASPIAEVPYATAADLEEALEASNRAWPEWRSTDVEKRGAILHKAAALLRERADVIAGTLTQEQGKILAEAKAEVLGSAQLFGWYAEEAKRDYGRTLVRPAGQLSRVIRQPVGPTATFTPWNFPIYLLAKKVSAALAAGCTVISRPPHETPGVATELFRALADAGIPKGVAQLVHGDADLISRTLIASRVIRKVSFTGSTNVGKHLMKLCADSMTRVTMELGGHAPVLIFDDCDLEKTLDMVVPQKFRNAGQVCVSPTRFYVQSGIYDAFIKGFAERTAKVKVGNGLEAEIMNEEPFGPVAVSRPFDTFEEVIEQANRLPYGLAAFAFTENGRRANLIGDLVESGMVGINTFAISVADAPFGGVKDSGFGSEGGKEGLESYQVVKAIHQA